MNYIKWKIKGRKNPYPITPARHPVIKRALSSRTCRVRANKGILYTKPSRIETSNLLSKGLSTRTKDAKISHFQTTFPSPSPCPDFPTYFYTLFIDYFKTIIFTHF